VSTGKKRGCFFSSLPGKGLEKTLTGQAVLAKRGPPEYYVRQKRRKRDLHCTGEGE
jgi:hypothetical protein